MLFRGIVCFFWSLLLVVPLFHATFNFVALGAIRLLDVLFFVVLETVPVALLPSLDHGCPVFNSAIWALLCVSGRLAFWHHDFRAVETEMSGFTASVAVC